MAVVRPTSAPETTVLFVDEQTPAPVRVVAFDSAGRATREADADSDSDELWSAIVRVADLTPEEARKLEDHALAILAVPQQLNDDTRIDGVLGILGGFLLVAALVVYVAVLPIVGVWTIVDWFR
jgi:hypothetical protein